MSNNFFLENRTVFEKMCKNMVDPARPTKDNVIRRTRIACWVT